MAVGGQISIGPGDGNGPPDRAGDLDRDAGRRKVLTGRFRGWFAKRPESLRATLGRWAGFPAKHAETGVWRV